MMSAVEALQSLFEADKLVQAYDDDPHRQVWSFSGDDTTLSLTLYLPKPIYFAQIITIILIQILICSLLSLVMYQFIIVIRPSLSDPQSSKGPSADNKTITSSTGLLVGWGFIIPFSLWSPVWLVDTLDIRNVGLRMGCATLPLTTTFLCLEAMYGFCPLPATQSLYAYWRHAGVILRPKYQTSNETSINKSIDDGTMIQLATIPTTSTSVLRSLQLHARDLALFGLLYHCTEPFDFYPFNPDSWLGHLYNTFVQALLLNVSVSLGLHGVCAIASIVTGCQLQDDFTRNPMFLSSSVSDFWGYRWNNLIHKALKQGKSSIDKKNIFCAYM